MPSIKPSDVIIALIWIYFLADSTWQGWQTPMLLAPHGLPEIPVWLIALVVLISGAVSGWFAFAARRRVMEDLPWVTTFMDKRYGQGTYNELCLKFRPVLLSILTSLLSGGATGLSAMLNPSQGDRAAYAIAMLLLGVGSGLLVAYLTSRRYGPALA